MSDDCFATLLFRDNLTTSRPRRQFAEDEAMVRLWLSRLLQLTSLRIIVMFTRLEEALCGTCLATRQRSASRS